MYSKVEIFNLALSHIGSKTVVSEVDDSAEADVCNRFYNLARDYTLADGNWPFARKIAALAKIADDPADGWAYSYAYPSDCLKIIDIPNDLEVSRDPRSHSYYNEIDLPTAVYEIYYGTSSQEIYTNQENARLRYTRRIDTQPGRFPPEFILALSYVLSSMVAPKVVGADNYEIVNDLMLKARAVTYEAIAKQINQENRRHTVESGFTRARS